MGYTHNKGFSAIESGFAVGKVGAEVPVIGGDLSVTLGGTKISASDRVKKVVKVALGAADTGGGVLSWANPENSSIIITKLLVNITTKSTGACTLDFGTTATNATTSSDNLMDGIDAGTAAALFDSASHATTTSLLLASGKWVTGSKASGAAAGLVGNAYIEYILV